MWNDWAIQEKKKEWETNPSSACDDMRMLNVKKKQKNLTVNKIAMINDTNFIIISGRNVQFHVSMWEIVLLVVKST